MTEVGTEAIVGSGNNSTDPLPVSRSPEQTKATQEKSSEKEKPVQSPTDEKPSPKSGSVESPMKVKGGTPKKGDSRNIFVGPRHSPRNPWTRNAPGEGGKEGGSKQVATVAGTEKDTAPNGGKGIKIPKGEVRRGREGYLVASPTVWGGGSVLILACVAGLLLHVKVVLEKVLPCT